MNFTDAVKSGFSKYVGFEGRASRSEYWYWILFVFGASIVLALIFPLLYILFVLGVFLPGLAVTIRRLHDTDKSGWWILIGLVPIVGGLILLYFYCVAGTIGHNRFGSDPLQPDEDDLRDVFG